MDAYELALLQFGDPTALEDMRRNSERSWEDYAGEIYLNLGHVITLQNDVDQDGVLSMSEMQRMGLSEQQIDEVWSPPFAANALRFGGMR